jgi:hypothetical protein
VENYGLFEDRGDRVFNFCLYGSVGWLSLPAVEFSSEILNQQGDALDLRLVFGQFDLN